MSKIKDLLVLKLGTSTFANEDGSVNTETLGLIAEQVAKLHNNYRIAIVSSGAVAAGWGHIISQVGHDAERKAAAAIGNHNLMRSYSQQFTQTNLAVAQILCDPEVLENRKRFLELQETLLVLWGNNVVPIINENDVVASHGLSFSDNDELATLLAVGFGAKQLLIGTSVAGLLDAGVVVRQINSFGEEIFSLVDDRLSGLGLGGMASKLRCAEHATKFGVETIIFDARVANNVLLASQRKTGTLCVANKNSSLVTKKGLKSW